LTIDIVKFNPEGDGVTAIYIYGVLFTYGDYYHDKIDDWVQGFIDGLEYAMASFNVVNWALPGDTKMSRDICELGATPPERFRQIRSNKLERVQ